MRILIVDDSEDARDLAEGALLSAGFDDILTADSEADAIDILKIFRTPSRRTAVDLVARFSQFERI